MIVGILSDTHGRAEAMAAGMAILKAHGAVHFLHCGDVGSTQVLDHLAGLPAGFVFGNNDWERDALRDYARTLGITCFDDCGEFELAGKRFALIHGDKPSLKQRILAEQSADYLLQGHTHLPDDRRLVRLRLINPGALHRARPRTVATLDTAADRVEFWEV